MVHLQGIFYIHGFFTAISIICFLFEIKFYVKVRQVRHVRRVRQVRHVRRVRQVKQFVETFFCDVTRNIRMKNNEVVRFKIKRNSLI